MKMKILLVFGFLFVTGCAYTSGNPKVADSVNASKIFQGKTTQQEIRSLFGDPQGTGFVSGKEKWNYSYTKVPYLPFMESKIVNLRIYFDPKTKKVTEYDFLGANSSWEEYHE